MNAQIVVDVKTIRPGTAGPVTGAIWLMLGRDSFPFHGWNDFIVVILEACCTAVLRVLGGASERENFHFMEGPYVVEVSCPLNGTLRLRGIERTRTEKERFCVDTQALAFLNKILICGGEVLDATRQMDCWSGDAAKLESVLLALRREASKLVN